MAEERPRPRARAGRQQAAAAAEGADRSARRPGATSSRVLHGGDHARRPHAHAHPDARAQPLPRPRSCRRASRRPSRATGCKLLYMAQIETRPPRFAIQVNSRNRVTRDYAYFVENRLRARYRHGRRPADHRLQRTQAAPQRSLSAHGMPSPRPRGRRWSSRSSSSSLLVARRRRRSTRRRPTTPPRSCPADALVYVHLSTDTGRGGDAARALKLAAALPELRAAARRAAAAACRPGLRRRRRRAEGRQRGRARAVRHRQRATAGSLVLVDTGTRRTRPRDRARLRRAESSQPTIGALPGDRPARESLSAGARRWRRSGRGSLAGRRPGLHATPCAELPADRVADAGPRADGVRRLLAPAGRPARRRRRAARPARR